MIGKLLPSSWAYSLAMFFSRKKNLLDPELIKDNKAFQQYNYKGGFFVLDSFKEFKHIADLKVLDWGCGDGGKSLSYIKEAQAKWVTGIDMIPEKIQLANELANELQIADKSQFILSDGTHLPLPNESFDRIISNSAFEHVKTSIILKTLKECFRVLKKDGVALIRFHPYRSRWGAHLVVYTPIPWVQYLFEEELLLNVWKSRYWEAYNRGEDQHYSPEEIRQVKHIKDIAHLNCLSSQDFESFLKQAGFKLIQKMITNQGAGRFLARGNWTDFFADHVVYILKKESKA